MTQAVDLISSSPSPISLQDFLVWDSGDDRLYELIEGEPMPMSDPTTNHEDVADNLCDLLRLHCLEKNLPFVPKRSKLISLGSRNERDTARRGDIVVFAKAEWERMKGLSSSAMAYTAPPLVIEVVSTNWRDDYLTKLAEYESIGVQECWIVDYAALGGMRYIGHPKQSTLSVYTMNPETGEFGLPQQFRGDTNIQSAVVPELAATAKALWKED
ncbi:Uma2 family endonuclease [Oscillatoria sp. CS-180]|uniref:Uma2 family endonuclease n=1 Tax=Oscillatoria sp. CS-180 TaxID=3021720 RepID=UPI00232E1303|nr:Uma2 family endonuclease [Oscillatoria sp. CS-180]MDB9529651.1 Uma2 family endonuclease [Oscillatoria sp. CS-180]